MKIPTICPKCHAPLINTALNVKGIEAWKKECNTKLNHSFICITTDDDVVVIGMSLSKTTHLKVFWDFIRNQILVHKGEAYVPFPLILDNVISIPWFEPNIHEYDKLIFKIKTYVTFS
jgi:hypothetical protein